MKSTTYFVVTNPSSPPQIAGSQTLSSMCIFISRHTCAYIHSTQHMCVSPRTSISCCTLTYPNCGGLCQFILCSYMGLPEGRGGNFDSACHFLSASHFHVAEMIISRAMLVSSPKTVLRNSFLLKLP